MSLSFQDLFPSEDGEADERAGTDQKRDGIADQTHPTMDDNRAIFSKPFGGLEKTGEEERKYLVSELLPFVPPAIAAQSGIPMELEVSVPMPADGSGEVKLSTIYQACPKLFAAEITPLNDSEITLPVKISGFSSEEEFASSPFVPGKAFGEDPEKESKPQSHHEPESGNPFWSPVSKSKADKGGQKTESSVAKEFREEEKPPKSEPVSQFGGFDEPAPRPEHQEKQSAEPEPEPDPVKTGFSGMPFGGDGDFVTLFSNDEDSKDEPTAEEEEDDFEPSTSWGSMFQPPKREPEVAEDLQETDKFSELGGFEDFSTASDKPDDDPEETGEKVVKEPLAPLGFEEPKSDPETSIETERESVEQSDVDPELKQKASEPETQAVVEPEPKFEADPMPENAPAPKPSTIEFQRSEKPKPEIEWTSAPLPVPAESAVAEKREAPESSIARGSHDDDLSDVELRAIFSTSEKFTLAKLARKVVGLPGIAACALSGSGKVVQASKSEENQLGAGAHDMVDAVRNIAKMTGMDEARSFTMKTEFGIVSLFLEGDCCLSVNHAESEFGPGIREKLIVIARTLHKLSE